MSTGVPTGSDCDVQPSVSVDPPVPGQCAAWPRYTVVPLVNTKLAVHWAPSVSVCTPGWIGAVAAGAHVGAAEACEIDGTSTEPVRRATTMRTRAEIFTATDTRRVRARNLGFQAGSPPQSRLGFPTRGSRARLARNGRAPPYGRTPNG